MNSKALWFVWFIILSMMLFASIFLARHFGTHPFVVWAIVGAIIIVGAILHFNLSGNIKKYPIETFKLVWKDSSYGDTGVYGEGIKYDMNFIPWGGVAKINVTTVDVRSGTTIVIFDKDEKVHVMNILDMDGFKRAVSACSNFNVETNTVSSAL
jgi:hypothetical protein